MNFEEKALAEINKTEDILRKDNRKLLSNRTLSFYEVELQIKRNKYRIKSAEIEREQIKIDIRSHERQNHRDQYFDCLRESTEKIYSIEQERINLKEAIVILEETIEQLQSELQNK